MSWAPDGAELRASSQMCKGNLWRPAGKSLTPRSSSRKYICLVTGRCVLLVLVTDIWPVMSLLRPVDSPRTSIVASAR